MLFFFAHHTLQYWYLPQHGQLEDPISTFVEAFLRLLLGIPIVVADFNLLEEEIAWKEEAGGDVRPVKATVLRVMVMCMLPHLHYTPNQLWAAAVQAPTVGKLGQTSCLPRWVTK